MAALMLSGCVAQKYTAAEQEMVNTLTGSNFQPATREMRENIETQDVLAQAAFWSREHNLNPGDLESSIKLASAVRRMGNPGQAIEITQQARALYPRDPYLAAEYAAALIASERGVDAIDTLDAALRNASGYARLWSLKGAALDQMEQYDLARKHYARAMQITPYDPSILANIGLSYALSGDAVTGEQWLRRAAAIPGAGPSVRQNLAIVLQLQGKTREADNILPRQQSAELAPPTRRAPSPMGYPTPQASHSYNPAQNSAPTYGAPNTQSRVYGEMSGGASVAAPSPYTTPSSVQNNSVPQLKGSSGFRGQASASPNSAYSNRRPSVPQGYAPVQTQSGVPYYGPTPQGAAPVMSASDAARAAARNIEQRNLDGRYVEPVAGPTAEQQSILERLAQNVGPTSNPTVQNRSPQMSQNYGYPAAPAPAYGGEYAQPQPQYQGQGQMQSWPQATPQYGNGYDPQQTAPRGAARRR